MPFLSYKKELTLPIRKIAITMPPELLQQVDHWAEKLHTSRSRFIATQVEQRLQELEDEEVSRRYNEAYQDEQARAENRELAEEMLHLAPTTSEDEQW